MSRPWSRLPAAVALGLLLAACASTPPEGDSSDGAGVVRAFVLEGRLSVRQPGRSDVLRMQWRHQPGEDRISLSTPLGGQVMLLEEQPGRVRLTLPDRAPVEAQDDAALMQSLLGYSLPVQGLAGWITGQVLPAASPADTSLPDTSPPAATPPGAQSMAANPPANPAGPERELRFEQDGWRGSLQRWRTVGPDALPGLLTVAREGLQLRLVVDQWRVQRGAL